MTTRDHLIYHLQENYSILRDLLPQLDVMHHQSGNGRLRELLQQHHKTLQGEMDVLERSLNLLSAEFKMERSTIVPALKEATERFKHRMNPSQEQLDIHWATEMLKVGYLMRAAYQGDTAMAQAIGEQDVARLLDENLQREVDDLQAMRKFLAQLLRDVSKGEARQAA
ncbi:MAG: DUF892 family protein [Armatimonadota bacterium]